MNLKNKKVFVTRPYKVVYKDGGTVVKVFTSGHGKANVFNEALCQTRVEETGLNIPRVLEVKQIDGEWAIVIEFARGVTLDELMKQHPEKLEEYMAQFVELQLAMHEKKAPRLTRQKDKFARKISAASDCLDATVRYELMTRLEAMPNHAKLCHGDFNPTNVIVGEDGTMKIVDWAHATQGNASGDAAITYLEFALEDQKKADLYLELFCKKSDTARQYVQKWLPIAAAAQLTKADAKEKDFLIRWTDIIDYQ